MSDIGGSLTHQNTHFSTSPFVRFVPFDEGGVLYVEGRRQLWVLNSTSAFIWCALPEAENLGSLAKWLSTRFSLDLDQALSDLQNTLCGFSREGLLSDQTPNFLPVQTPDYFNPRTAPLFNNLPSTFSSKYYAVSNYEFSFGFQQHEFITEFLSLMKHFEIKKAQDTQSSITVFAMPEEADKWYLVMDKRCCFSAIAPNEIIPLLIALIFSRISETFDNELLFHSAVVGQSGRVVLFPAEAGSGKTTLAASLAARGWSFYSDELAVLSPYDLKVSPLPLPMSIKAGSLGVLQGFYPSLAQSAVHHRADGKNVRYLCPPTSSLPRPEMRASIRAIVFPKYDYDSVTRINQIGKIEAMRRLAKTGSFARPLTYLDIETMIKTLEDHPVYELIFSNTDDACSVLDQEIF